MTIMTSVTFSDLAAGKKKRKGPTKAKAKKILADGKIRGKPLTAKQKRFFHAIAG